MDIIKNMKEILQDLSYAELEEVILALGEKKFRARQIYDGIMQGKALSALSNISAALKEKLLENNGSDLSGKGL